MATLDVCRASSTTLAQEILGAQTAAISGASVDGVRMLGAGLDAILASWGELERRTRESVWNLQARVPMPAYSEDEGVDKLNARSRARRLDMRLVTTAYALEVNPILSSMEPSTRVGFVPFDMIVLDRVAVVTPGPRSNSGLITSWLVTRPSLVTRAAELYLEIWASARPCVAPGTTPPFSRRQVNVVRLMSQGRADVEIARTLEVSPRTVEADVAKVLQHLGLKNRVELASRVTTL